MIVGIERSEAAAYLGLAAVGALAVWLLVLALLAVWTRTKEPAPQPAGLEFGGDEPPAVVNLLASGWKVRGEAMSSTLVDLAARGVVAFDAGPDGRVSVRVDGEGRGGESLTPYETQVLEVVRQSSSNGVVPLDALTLGTEGRAKSFERSFAKAVSADARSRGLSRARWSAAMTLLVALLALAPALLAAGALAALPDAHHTSSTSSSSSSSSSSSDDDNPVALFIGAAVVGWGGLMALFHRLRAERDTPAGLVAAGRWLGLRENLLADGTFPSLPPTAVAVWDRYLAYAVALGVAATTERSIPLGAESDTEAWSSVGGQWRIVRVRYPRRVPPGWGRAPWKNTFAGLFAVAIGAAAGAFALPAAYDAQADLLKDATAQDHRIALGVSIGIAAIGFVVAVVVLRGVWMLALGLADIGRGRTIEGRVLRVRTRNERTYVAVDDGTDDHLSAWVSATGVAQGSDVRARVAPHVGYVRELTTTGTGVSVAPGDDGGGSATTGVPLADLFSGPASSFASPLPLDPAWVSSLVGVPVTATGGTLLQGDAGLAIGAVTMQHGAQAAFAMINRLHNIDRTPVRGVGDEAVRFDEISGVAARLGDRGVLAFVRGGTLDDDRRYRTATDIAKWALSGTAAQSERLPSSPPTT